MCCCLAAAALLNVDVSRLQTQDATAIQSDSLPRECLHIHHLVFEVLAIAMPAVNSQQRLLLDGSITSVRAAH